MVVTWLLMISTWACSPSSPPLPLEDVSAVPAADPYRDYLTPDGLTVAFRPGIGEQTLLELLADERLQPLKSVTIRGQQLTAASVRAIMTSPLTEELSSLFLPESTIGDDGLVVLAASPRLAGIEYLNLTKVGATAAGVEVLASSPYLQPKDLSLGGQNVGDAGAVALAEARQIKALHLETAGIGEEGLTALLEKTSAEVLVLSENPGGLRDFLAMSSTIRGLTIADCGLATEDLAVLFRARAENLETLSLKLTPLTDADLAAILQAPWFTQLKQLELDAQLTSSAARRAVISAFEGDFLSIYRADL